MNAGAVHAKVGSGIPPSKKLDECSTRMINRTLLRTSRRDAPRRHVMSALLKLSRSLGEEKEREHLLSNYVTTLASSSDF